MADQETSLKDSFLAAQKHQDALNSADSLDDNFKFHQDSALRALENCRHLISRLALYSINEEIDDISTQDLQYLQVDFLLAELLLKSYDTNRLGQLQRASDLFESFLTRLDHYSILSKTDRDIFERYKEGRKSFQIVQTNSAEERRNKKSLRSQSGANSVDEEIRRNLYLAEIALSVHQTFQSLDLISQELLILSQISTIDPGLSKNSTDDRDRHHRNENFTDRLEGSQFGGLGQRGGPLLNAKGKPLQPFTLTDKRTQLQKGVFRPGHNLPTMSIDEYLEEEKKRGGIIEGGGNTNASQIEPDEDNMDLVDAATYKAREWDEFVEANPKGAGNTVNRG